MTEDQKRMIHLKGKLDIPTTEPNKNGRIYSETAVQDMVKKMRKLNEDLEKRERKNLKTPDDQAREEEGLSQELEPFRVMTEFRDLEVYDDVVKWGGVVDNGILFKYRVPAEPGELGYKFTYNKGEFNVDDEDNKPITDAIINYYDKFYQYWRDNNQWREGIFPRKGESDNEVK